MISMQRDPFGGYEDDDTVISLPLRAARVRLPDPRSIPPRPWLYGTHLMKGFVSLLVSPGGVGKSQLALAVAVSVARGRGLLGHHVHHQANAWLLNLEDPLDEMERRLAALMLHHQIPDADLVDTLFMNSGRDRRLCMAQLDSDGGTIIFPDKEAIIATARACAIGLIIVDPYVKSHTLEENSNPHMDAAATAWSEVADAVGCAVLIVRHVRKGVVVDIDSARGGSALKDAARMASLLSPMSAEEAERMNVAEADRWRHVRLGDGKANMAPRADRADWMVMRQVELGNATELYPRGDTVTALERWTPPPVAGSASMSQVVDALDRIAQGPSPGEFFSPSAAGRTNGRWAGNVLVELLGLQPTQAASLLKEWLKNGVLVTVEYDSPGSRRAQSGVRVVQAKLDQMRGGR